MMSSATLRRDTVPSIRRRAGVLLALLAHLAFMATPVHAAMVQGGGAAPAMATAAADAPAHLEEQYADEGQDGHCILRWTTSLSWRGIVALGVAALPTRMSEPLLGREPERPAARALGPPLLGDPQALLQVFRL